MYPANADTYSPNLSTEEIYLGSDSVQSRETNRVSAEQIAILQRKINELRELIAVLIREQQQASGLSADNLTDQLLGANRGSNGVDVYAVRDARKARQKALENSAKSGGSLSQFSSPLSRIFISIGDGKFEVVRGETLVIEGAGFLERNTIHFGDEFYVPRVSRSLGRLEIEVPNIPAGVYDIIVSNADGVSDAYKIAVTDGAGYVKITSFSPRKVEFGETVTLRGEGFVDQGNVVLTPFGEAEIVSESTDEIEFVFAPDEFKTASEVPSDIRQWDGEGAVGIRVLNQNGASPVRNLSYSL